MDIKSFFSPIDYSNFDDFYIDKKDTNFLLNNIIIHTEDSFPDLKNVQIAILGVPEEKNAFNNIGCSKAPDEIRQQLYQLYAHTNLPQIVDLGNFISAPKINDTYVALGEVLAELIQNNIVPIILGGSQDITFANYCAYEQLEQVVNIVSIDSRFDIGKEESEFTSKSYLHRVILRNPNYLFNYSNIGYQSYFVSQAEVELMEKLYFDALRLGLAQQDLIDCEPIIRNADMLTLDMSAIRFGESPGCNQVSPNGFSGKEICMLARYAGRNKRLSSFGIYEYNPFCDIAHQSAKLIAQIIWYFIDGFIIREDDSPNIAKNNFYKYYVTLHENAYEIIFYRSKVSDLWWMEIPCEEKKTRLNKHYLIPCSLKDYETACRNEIPDRWLQTYQKIKPF